MLYYTEWEMLGKDQFLLEETAPDPDEGGIDSERLFCLEHLLREDNVKLFSEQSSRLLEEWLTGRPRKMLFEQALRRSLDVIHRYSMTDLALAPSRRELALTALMERSDSIDIFLEEWRGFLKEYVLNRQHPWGIICWYSESKRIWSNITLTPSMPSISGTSAGFHTPISPAFSNVTKG